METKVWNILSVYMENVSNMVAIYICLFDMNPLYLNCCIILCKIDCFTEGQT